MSTINTILDIISGLGKTNENGETDLYTTIFGDKSIPVEVALEPATKTTLLVAVGILGVAAILVGYVIAPNR
jgi:hypothetical protein